MDVRLTAEQQQLRDAAAKMADDLLRSTPKSSKSTNGHAVEKAAPKAAPKAETRSAKNAKGAKKKSKKHEARALSLVQWGVTLTLGLPTGTPRPQARRFFFVAEHAFKRQSSIRVTAFQPGKNMRAVALRA